MFVDGNLFDKITTLDSHFLFCDKMLYYDVSHVLPESIALLVEAMDRREYQLVISNCSILTPNSLKVGISQRL